ncbi:MAG: hypothetical protein Kow0062_29320 [Acidobacteriota bacterium]
MSEAPRGLALAGPMGAGKSSACRLLARWLDREPVDLDERIVAREGRSIPELFAEGEARFRRAEREALEALLAEGRLERRVVALGGGTLEHADLAGRLAREAVVVHLDADGAELARRLGPAARAARPLLAGLDEAGAADRLEALRRERAAGRRRAMLHVHTTGLDERATAVAVLRALWGPPEGPWSGPPRPVVAGSDDVVLGRGTAPDREGDGELALLVDAGLPSVHRRALDAAFADARTFERLGGERAKSWPSLVGLWDEMLHAGLDRDARLVVAGGGTLTDLGGLAAHTFKRGLAVEYVPTTLLGQVDAALGGKTGINLDHVKNVVGTFRLPRRVHLDPLYVPTLAPVDLRGGLAEAYKSGLIGDPELCGCLAGAVGDGELASLARIEEIIGRAARVKLDVVARDLEEAGPRRALNLGHTLGHALEAEAAARGQGIAHGDAVAIGIVFALRLAARLGRLADGALSERVPADLEALGLPVRAAGFAPGDAGALLAAMRGDKKRAGGRLVFALPLRAGEIAFEAVPDGDVLAALEEFLA